MLKDWLEDFGTEAIVITLVILAILALIVAAVITETNNDNEFRAWCKERSGHVIDGPSDTRYDPATKVIRVNDSLLCLTEDGKILGVRE